MALIDPKQTRTLEHPSEPGTTVEVRPLMAGDMAGLSTDGSVVKLSLEAMAAVIVAWSYDDPPTLANVERLDFDTFVWLSQQVLAFSGVRDALPKDGSNNGSAPGHPPDEDFPESSAT